MCTLHTRRSLPPSHWADLRCSPWRSAHHSPATVPVSALGSAAPVLVHLPTCIPAAPVDTPDPAAHTPLPLSISPTTPPPSPNSAPRISPLALPPLLPVLANSALLGSLAGSTPHSSALLLQKSPPSLPVSALLALQTTPGCSGPSHTPAPSHSTPLLLAAALPPASPLSLKSAPPASPPSLPAPVPSAPTSARSSPSHTSPSRTPSPHANLLRSLPLIMSDQISPLPLPATLPSVPTLPSAVLQSERSAIPTSPETTVPGSDPASGSNPLPAARTVNPDAHTPPNILPVLAVTSPAHS